MLQSRFLAATKDQIHTPFDSTFGLRKRNLSSFTKYKAIIFKQEEKSHFEIRHREFFLQFQFFKFF